jgi:arylsulfatase A
VECQAGARGLVLLLWLGKDSLFRMERSWIFGVLAAGLLGIVEASGEPNVLLIMLDDSGHTDFGCYGSEVDTPRIDALAAEGMRFTDCHSAAPNCSPSRAGMLTGRMPTRVGMYSYVPPKHPMHLRDEEVTIAELLKEKGYATGHFGKWHLSQLEWTSEQQPQPRDQGFEYSFGTTNNSIPSHHNPHNFVRNGEAVEKLKGYSCQLVADEFSQWLDTVDEGQPFLGVVWFNEPHTPIGSPPDLVEKYERRLGAKAKKQATYYANIENVDRAVGRILDKLDAAGRADDTFVFVTSDNGGLNPWSTQGLRGKKSFVYEGGHREPGILRWPGRVPAGEESDATISHLDLLPTICEIADLDAPADRKLDGVSLTPLFAGEAIERETPLFWFFYRVEPAAAMRSGDWVILGYLDDPLAKHTHSLTAPDIPMIKSAPLHRFELYNLKDDPLQESDLFESHPERAAELAKQMKAIHREVVAEGPIWELEDWNP